MMKEAAQPAVAGPVEPTVRLVSAWMGQPVTDLSREELLEVVEWCGGEIQRLQGDRDKWMRSGDALKYLMDGRP